MSFIVQAVVILRKSSLSQEAVDPRHLGMASLFPLWMLRIAVAGSSSRAARPETRAPDSVARALGVKPEKSLRGYAGLRLVAALEIIKEQSQPLSANIIPCRVVEVCKIVPAL